MPRNCVCRQDKKKFVGPTGPNGTSTGTGSTGALGPQGTENGASTTGPTGSAGWTGPTGIVGAQGNASNTGAIGFTGPTGAIGLIGPTGTFGITGPHGTIGPTGNMGLTGQTGATGSQGLVGSMGSPFISVSMGTSPIGELSNNALGFIFLLEQISFCKKEECIEIAGTMSYAGTFDDFNQPTLLTISVTINREQVGLYATPNMQIKESASIGLYDMPVYYSNNENLSVNGRMLFQNINPTEIHLIFQFAKSTLPAGGTLGQLSFIASAQTELIVPLKNVQEFEPDLTMIQSPFLFIPPDSVVSVGPSHIIPIVNVHISLHNKSTPFAQLDRVDLNSFWSTNVTPPVTPLGVADRVFDPWTVYDPFAQRFVVIATRIDTSSGTPATYRGFILFAVSRSATPTTLSTLDWEFYQYDRTVNPTVNPTFPDYPKLGYDNLAYYISENNFLITGNSYVSSNVFALRKTNLTIAINTGITQPCIPVESYESTSSAFYCVRNFVPGTIRVFMIDKITNLLITSSDVALGSTSTIAIGCPQPDVTLLPIDNRTNEQSAVLRSRNGTDRIWTAISVNTPSVINSNGTLKAVVRWAEIDLGLTGLIPTLVQTELKEGDGNDGIFYPHINVDSLNNMSIACSIVSLNRFPGIAMFARLVDDPLNTTRAVVPLRPGLNSYEVTFSSNFNRFGDYSGLALDPSDKRTFWAFNEYSIPGPTGIPGVNGAWATTVIGYRLDETSILPSLSFTHKQNTTNTNTSVAVIELEPESSLPFGFFANFD